jgi:glyoxylase-like metal-dependent hydrolase (beta-lactamase superfamily II)
MILHQFYLNCLAHASYLVGDEDAGAAVVVDPAFEIEQYLAEADHRGVRIVRVLETRPLPPGPLRLHPTFLPVA